MSRLIVILAITTAASASTSAYLWKQTQQERSRADELQARVAQLEQPRIQREPAQAFPPAVDNPPSTVAKPARSAASTKATAGMFAAAAPAAEAQMGTNFGEVQERFARQQRALMEDPEYREARRMQQRMMLRQSYPDLAEGAGISPEQADRLLDLLADQQVDPAQEFFPVDGKNNSEAAARWQRKMEEKQRADQAAIAELLGSDGQQRWADYQSSLGARFRVRQLSTELGASGTPLSQDQLKPLQQALAAGDEQMRKQWEAQAQRMQTLGRTPTAAEQLELQEEALERMAQNNEVLRSSVSQVLTREQLDAYKQIQDRELQMMEAQLRIQRAQMEAQERSGIPMDTNNVFYSVGPSANVAIRN